MIKATVKAGAEFQEDQPVTVAKLNALGTPTVDISGAVESGDIATEAVTNAKLKPAVDSSTGDANSDAAVKDNVVAEDAAIKLTKLEAVSDGLLVAGDANGKPSAHSVGGEVKFQRASRLQVQPADGESTVGIAIDDEIRFDGSSVKIIGKVIAIEDVDGTNKNIFARITSGSGETLSTEVKDVLVNPDAITVKKLSQDSTQEIISAGDKVTTTDASGIVKAVTATAGTTTDSNDYYTHQWELTLVSVEGHFIDSSAVSIDTGLSDITVASGAVAKGRTVIADSVTDFDGATNSLATYIVDEEEASLVKTGRLVAPSSAEQGQYLRVTADGGIAPQAQDAIVPICKGELNSVKINDTKFLSGNSNISVWEIRGAMTRTDPNDGTVVYGIVIYNSSDTSDPEAHWQAGDQFVVCRANGQGTSPAGLTVDTVVYKVKESYAGTDISGGTSSQAFLTLTSDSGTDLVNTDFDNFLQEPASSAIGFIGRQVTDPDNTMSGARLFKSAFNNERIGSFSLIFDEQAANAKYVPIIQGYGIWYYGYADGHYPSGRDVGINDDDEDNHHYTHTMEPHVYRKAQNGFTFSMNYRSGTDTYDPRWMTILVYPF